MYDERLQLSPISCENCYLLASCCGLMMMGGIDPIANLYSLLVILKTSCCQTGTLPKQVDCLLPSYIATHCIGKWLYAC